MQTRHKPRQLLVKVRDWRATRGRLVYGALDLPCALGRTGIVVRKREGDGATPVGIFPIRIGFYRPDKIRKPASSLSMAALCLTDGWCDAPDDRNYNRAVDLPYPASAETMWRADHLYDIGLIPEHNHSPRIRGGGSAIFVHLATPNFSATEGCVALQRQDMLKLLGVIRPGDELVIGCHRIKS
ncbi:MAG: L,D-transpeptidase family protein [Hyphomicrobiaceae bacterium]